MNLFSQERDAKPTLPAIYELAVFKRALTRLIFLTNIGLEITLVTGVVSGPTFERLFHLSKTQLGLSLGATSLGILVMSLATGHLTQRRGSFPMLISGLVGVMIGIVLIILARDFLTLTSGLAVVGIAAAFIANANSTVLADLFREKLRQVMSLASAIWFTASAVSATAIGKWLELARDRDWSTWSFRTPYLFNFLFVGVCLLLTHRIARRITKPPVKESSQISSTRREQMMLHAPMARQWFWIPVLGFLHGLMIIVMMAWLNPMGQAKFCANEFQGALLVGMMALGIATGRFLLSIVKTRWDDRLVLAFSSFVGGTLFVLGLFAHRYWLTISFMGIGGLMSCATLPCILSLVGTKFVEIKAKVYGYMTASIGLSGLVGPTFVGILADHGLSLPLAMVISPLAACVLCFCSLLWKFQDSRCIDT